MGREKLIRLRGLAVASFVFSLHASLARAADVALFAGGLGNSGKLATAETYDSKTQQFTPTANGMSSPRSSMTATTLKNKTVLIVGRFGNAGLLASADLYNPKTRKFFPEGTGRLRKFLNEARGEHTATLLNDGRVLIVGGFGNSGVLDSAEVFDPVKGKVSETAGMNTGRIEHTATLLKDGRVLVAGGSDGSKALASAQVFNPKTNSFSSVGDLTAKRRGHSAVLLSNGMVLVTGGDNVAGTIYDTAELFDPKTNMFKPTTGNKMIVARTFHASVLLSGGMVLILGGFSHMAVAATADLYDPKTEMFAATGSRNRSDDDFVIAPVAGGVLAGGTPDNSAEVYSVKAGTWSPVGNMSDRRICGAGASLKTAMSGIYQDCD